MAELVPASEPGGSGRDDAAGPVFAAVASPARRQLLGLQVAGLEDQAAQRAGRHRLEPGHQGERGLPARDADLEPALARPHLDVGDQLEAERAGTEVPGPVLVSDRHREQLKVGEVHAPTP